MRATVIETRALSKRYGRHRGLEGLDLSVQEGEVFGFLGPNGAGKSTTIRLLLDLIRPTAGSVRVLGADPAIHPGLRARIGYLPGELTLEGRQNVAGLLAFFASLSGGVPQHRIDELAERLGLDTTRHVKGLSKGNKQKVGIVQAFMHRPDLLILDEPTSGLDPLVQQELLALVREARDAGQTVFMSSHVLSEVEDVADRVAIIRAGRLVLVSDVASLRGLSRLEVTFTDPVTAGDFEGLPGIGDVTVQGAVLRCTLDGPADQVIKAVARYTVATLRAERPDLEEVFLTHYRPGRTAPTEVPNAR
jgi:ABC-2 type transport system ATP-binding protein